MERARPILQAYEEAKALLEQGTWLVSLDEKASIQARQRPQETEPANSGNPAHDPRDTNGKALCTYSQHSVLQMDKSMDKHASANVSSISRLFFWM